MVDNLKNIISINIELIPIMYSRLTTATLKKAEILISKWKKGRSK